MDIFRYLRQTTMGIHAPIVVTDLFGRTQVRERIYLDSAATCLAIQPVGQAMIDYYTTSCANSHTSATASGRDTTEQLHHAHEDLGKLMGYDPQKDSVIFIGSGTTAATCFLSDAINCREHKPLAIVSSLEHHSNLLPWQRHFELLYIKAMDDGALDMAHLASLLRENTGKVCVVAVTAVSNVTGVITPLDRIAELTHAAGALLFVDAAQGASHIPINKTASKIDFIAGSGHKMYAPGSPGWLIATKQFFKGMGWMAGPIGGGSVDRVELDRVWLKDDPSERYEAGTPNIPGSIGLGVAARLLREIGMDKVLEHERALVEQCIRQVQAVPDAVVYGPLDASNKTSVVTFNIGSMPHGIVAAALNDMFAIQTRNGCFCAQPYSRQQIASACTTRGYCEPIQAGKTGMVRASFGIYSDASDIDALVAGLRVISEHKAHIMPLYEETSDGTWEHKAFRSSTGFDYRKLVTKFVEEAR